MRLKPRSRGVFQVEDDVRENDGVIPSIVYTHSLREIDPVIHIQGARATETTWSRTGQDDRRWLRNWHVDWLKELAISKFHSATEE